MVYSERQGTQVPCPQAFGPQSTRSRARKKRHTKRSVATQAGADLQRSIVELLQNGSPKEALSKLPDVDIEAVTQPHTSTAWIAEVVKALQIRLGLYHGEPPLATVSGMPHWLGMAGKGAKDLENSLEAHLDSVFSSPRADTARHSVSGLSQSLTQHAERVLSSLSGAAGTSSEAPSDRVNASVFISRTVQDPLDSIASSLKVDPMLLDRYMQSAKSAGLTAEQQFEGFSERLAPSFRLTDNDFIFSRVVEGLQTLPDLLLHGPKEMASLLSSAQQFGPRLAVEGGTGHSFGTVAGIAVALSMVLALSTLTVGKEVEPLPPMVYDVNKVADYWQQRPVAVARRSVVVAFEGMRWAIGLGLDMLTGADKRNASRRAVELRGVLERLGPAYVKVAQAVSTRVDLLQPEYLVEIERLQDRVPPFPTSVAEETMQRAFGRPSSMIYERLSKEPLAAASLGQVYRGTLRGEYGGGDVAVKVQRPGVLLSVALDLYLIRGMAVNLDRLFKTHWTGIIDEWAVRFFHELDYAREAKNAIIFKQQMSKLEGIVVPDVYLEFSSQEVLTTAWVEGEKLSESNAADVRKLCNTLLNCYLIQLLETGFLHADPHPGNLLRTPDGKICILDFGLMTEITPDRSMALVEYIAHLTTEDYASIPGDLYKLGFIPEGAPDPLTSGLVEPLGRILKQLSQGGGAKRINIDEVTVEIEALSKEYPFQIPSYFALILRAFSVIEGIALRVDPNYAIVQECFPYLSRRLFTDNSPRVRAALQQMLYGKKKRLDIDRLQRMANGFGSFTVGGLTTTTPPVDEDAPLLNDTTKEALRTLFRPEGSYIQEVFVAESVAAVDAISREVMSQVSRGVLGSVPAMATLSFVEALGPLRLFVLPVPTPLEVMSRVTPNLALTEEDEEALSTAKSLLSMFQSQPESGLPTDRDSLQKVIKLAQELQPLLPELLPGIIITGELFIRKLIRRVAMRVAEEAGKPPSAQKESAESPPARTAAQQAEDNIRWMDTMMAFSPLWFLMPPGFAGAPQASYAAEPTPKGESAGPSGVTI